MVDFKEIPLIALSSSTKFLLSSLLNPPKVIPTCDGIPRDWRGLADLFGFSGEMIPSIANHSDPTEYILNIITEKNSKISIDELTKILEKIDRWDVIDDSKSLFDRDAEDYQKRLEKCKIPTNVLNSDIDNQMLTIDDLYRLKAGLTIQVYDAFLLCADEDIDIANEMILNLEQKHNLKLCVKDRDLISGVTFEHEAVMQLISERCNRLLVVLSPNFLKSPANKFFLNYAQAVGIEKRQRKIIPCLYKACTPPPQLMYTFILDYNKSGLYDFWGRLKDSIKSLDSNTVNQSITIKDNNPVVHNVNNPSISDEPTNEKVLENTPVTHMNKKPLRIFPWSQKKISKQLNEPDNKLVNEDDMSMINFPTLTGLDSLESMPVENLSRTEKKKTVMKVCVKKIKSLVVKS